LVWMILSRTVAHLETNSLVHFITCEYCDVLCTFQVLIIYIGEISLPGDLVLLKQFVFSCY
jgi:hypothetical protein